MNTSRAWSEVDLGSLDANLNALARRVGPGVGMLLVVKADAYGHGAVSVARRAAEHGPEGFCVTTVEEALELRESGLPQRILVLGPALGGAVRDAVAAGIEFTLTSADHFPPLLEHARSAGRVAGVHLKVDTGMHRLGLDAVEALPLLGRIVAEPALRLAGVMTHLAADDGARTGGTELPQARFEAFLEAGRAQGWLRTSPLVHLANSAAVLSGLDPLHDAVRIGGAAYGISPCPSLSMEGLEPVLALRARIVHLKGIEAGDDVGYGGTWTAPRPSRIATLPLGYDDGVDWRLAQGGEVLVRGRRVPIVGRISMDYTTIDVTDIPGLELGEPVTLLGQDGDERIRVEELARLAGTLPYAMTCSIGKRIERVVLDRPTGGG